MLENIPLSGYALCYAPLALMLIGFLVFAYLTDANARRTYLRRMDPRPDSERTGPVLVERSEAIRSETPAGTTVIIDPNEGDGDTVVRMDSSRRKRRSRR